MFKPFQIVEFMSTRGIVTAVEGRFVTIMWEEKTHDVSFRCVSEYQLRRSVKVLA